MLECLCLVLVDVVNDLGQHLFSLVQRRVLVSEVGSELGTLLLGVKLPCVHLLVQEVFHFLLVSVFKIDCLNSNVLNESRQ